MLGRLSKHVAARHGIVWKEGVICNYNETAAQGANAIPDSRDQIQIIRNPVAEDCRAVQHPDD